MKFHFTEFCSSCQPSFNGSKILGANLLTELFLSILRIQTWNQITWFWNCLVFKHHWNIAEYMQIANLIHWQKSLPQHVVGLHLPFYWINFFIFQQVGSIQFVILCLSATLANKAIIPELCHCFAKTLIFPSYCDNEWPCVKLQTWAEEFPLSSSFVFFIFPGLPSLSCLQIFHWKDRYLGELFSPYKYRIWDVYVEIHSHGSIPWLRDPESPSKAVCSDLIDSRNVFKIYVLLLVGLYRQTHIIDLGSFHT